MQRCGGVAGRVAVPSQAPAQRTPNVPRAPAGRGDPQGGLAAGPPSLPFSPRSSDPRRLLQALQCGDTEVYSCIQNEASRPPPTQSLVSQVSPGPLLLVGKAG